MRSCLPVVDSRCRGASLPYTVSLSYVYYCSCNAPGAFSEPAVALAAGYGSPKAMEESPVPSASSPTSFISSVMQVRRYSWRPYEKNVAYGKRRQFVGTNKQIQILLYFPLRNLSSQKSTSRTWFARLGSKSDRKVRQ